MLSVGGEHYSESSIQTVHPAHSVLEGAAINDRNPVTIPLVGNRSEPIGIAQVVIRSEGLPDLRGSGYRDRSGRARTEGGQAPKQIQAKDETGRSFHGLGFP